MQTRPRLLCLAAPGRRKVLAGSQQSAQLAFLTASLSSTQHTHKNFLCIDLSPAMQAATATSLGGGGGDGGLGGGGKEAPGEGDGSTFEHWAGMGEVWLDFIAGGCAFMQESFTLSFVRSQPQPELNNGSLIATSKHAPLPFVDVHRYGRWWRTHLYRGACCCGPRPARLCAAPPGCGHPPSYHACPPGLVCTRRGCCRHQHPCRRQHQQHMQQQHYHQQWQQQDAGGTGGLIHGSPEQSRVVCRANWQCGYICQCPRQPDSAQGPGHAAGGRPGLPQPLEVRAWECTVPCAWLKEASLMD